MSATNGFINSLQSFKLGIVTISGIIAPGLWFCGTTLIYLNFILGSDTLSTVKSNSDKFISLLGPHLASIFGFLVVYVVGSILRILPPDGPDRLSPIPQDDSGIAKKERFPYRNLPVYLRSRRLIGLAKLVPWDKENWKEEPNESIKKGKKEKKSIFSFFKSLFKGQSETDEEEKRESKTFLHFVKLYIAEKKPEMASYLAQQEAFIRLMSGVFYAIVFSSIVFCFCLLRRDSFGTQLFKTALGVFIFNLLILVGILKAFHYQRLRELVMILSAYFIIGEGEKSPYEE